MHSEGRAWVDKSLHSPQQLRDGLYLTEIAERCPLEGRAGRGQLVQHTAQRPQVCGPRVRSSWESVIVL